MADHQRVNIHHSQMSCGVFELSRLTDDETEGAAFQIASYLYHPARGAPCAFFVYSDHAEGETASKKLNSMIYERGWGSITEGPVSENPGTGNLVRVYIWNVCHDKFKTWYRDQRVARLKRI